MDFVTKSFRKDETLTSWTLLKHICPLFWVWLLLYSTITPKSEDKYVEKVFNSIKLHFSKVPSFKIGTLDIMMTSYQANGEISLSLRNEDFFPI